VRNEPRIGGFARLHFLWYMYLIRRLMAEEQEPQKISLIFFRTASGSESVREWLKWNAKP